MNTDPLFQTIKIGNISLNNRILMAPMTRSRTAQNSDAPTELNALYYGQRASAGLIITEATQISLQGQGYASTPGIYSEAQIAGWKLVTKSVHDNGGKIFLQLWHVGRVSNSAVNGMQPVAPSPIIAEGTSVYVIENGEAKFLLTEKPREATKEDIEQIISDFVRGAKNAIEAGFDGVEIHGANGYLIDQFLRTNSNHRTDEYGGSKENRIRILLEITSAVANAVGNEKTGVRLSPFITFKDMSDPEIVDTILISAKALNDLDIAYIHLCEADWDDAPVVTEDFRKQLRANFKNTIIATGGYNPEMAAQIIETGLVDMVGFGRLFVSNPDLPARIKQNGPYAEIKDKASLFGGTSIGYIDYPALEVKNI